MRLNLKSASGGRIGARAQSLLAALVLVGASGLAWAAAGAEAGHGGFSSTDWFRVMNFAVLAGVLFMLLRKPIPRALSDRIRGIENQLKDLEARKAEAETHLAEYNLKLSTLEKEAEGIIADYIRQGQEAKARILKEAEAASEKIQIQARRNIEHEYEATKARLQQEIFAKSLAQAEELLKRNITAQDQSQLVEEYLRKVVAS
jgi:F-type H+-transporting ATPase subunit b